MPQKEKFALAFQKMIVISYSPFGMMVNHFQMKLLKMPQNFSSLNIIAEAENTMVLDYLLREA